VPRISAIVVSWNVWPMLAQCLKSLLPQLGPGDEVLVVDNGSTDETVQSLPELFPSIELIANLQNAGYAAAVNLALARARGQWLLLLNPDTVLREGAIQELLLIAEKDQSAAVVGPRLLYPNGDPQPSRRRFARHWEFFLDASPWHWSRVGKRLLRRCYCLDTPDSHAQAVDWLWGACLLVRAAALAEVGGLDPAFFMYCEEMDLCQRLRSLGWSVVYQPAATVVHWEGKSSEKVPLLTLLRYHRSRLLYAAKYGGWRWARALAFLTFGSFCLELLVEVAKLVLGHKPELRQERVRSYRALLRELIAAVS